MKLVNADAFIKEYSDNPANIIFLGKRNGKAFDAGRAAERSVLLEALSKFQTIDPATLRPYGVWKRYDRNNSNLYMCSVCEECYVDATFAHGKMWKYCPECGARLKGIYG